MPVVVNTLLGALETSTPAFTTNKGRITTPNLKSYNSVVDILRRYGTDAHIYLPGIGAFNGYTLGNYLESTGNTAATVDNPVGLVLDAGQAVSAELIADPGFDNAGAWSTAQPTSGSVIVSGGVVRINTIDGSYCTVYPTPYFNAVIGKTYQYVVTVTSATGNVAVGFGGAQSVSIGSVGVHTGFMVAINTAGVEIKRAGGPCDVTITSFSVKEVPGIHASQGTTANKPILRKGAVNLLTYSNALTHAAWNASFTTRVAGALDPLGGTAATTVTAQAVLYGGLSRKAVTYAGSTPYTVCAIVKAAGSNFAGLRLSRSSAINDIYPHWNLTTGVGTLVTAIAGTNTGISSVSLGNGWWLLVLNYTTDAAPAATTDVAITSATGQIGITPSPTESIYVYTVGVFLGTLTASDIQAAGGIPITTTVPVSAGNGNNYWEFDGVNDSLALSSMPFQQADDRCVIVGFNAGGTGLRGLYFVGDTTGWSFVMYLAVLTGGQVVSYYRDDARTLASVVGSSLINGLATVASARVVSGSRIIRVNGVAEGGTNSTVLGATVLNLSSIGNNPAGPPSAYLNGKVYPVIAIKGTVSDADLLVLERWVGSLTGPTGVIIP